MIPITNRSPREKHFAKKPNTDSHFMVWTMNTFEHSVQCNCVDNITDSGQFRI